MTVPSTLLTPPGEPTAPGDLGVLKARQLTEYLSSVGSECFARLLEVRRHESAAEVVVFEVRVERPQELAHDICGVETLAAVFPADDETHPELLALRADFPLVPHVNLRAEELPRSLCLYDQPYENARLTWTPASFLKRIHVWLARTADGTLHPDDQMLEPLILGSPWRLIVPADFGALNQSGAPELLDVHFGPKHAGQQTLVALRTQSGTRSAHFIAATFACPPQPHGIISHVPATLGELDALCGKAGLPLVASLTKLLREWFLSKPVLNVLKARVLLVVSLPKTRHAGGPVESVETRAFLTAETVENFGVRLGVFDLSSGVAGGAAGYILGEPPVVGADTLAGIHLLLTEVHHALARKAAAWMNGIEAEEADFVAIGMGALGSQALNHLIRAGFGKWTIIDPDILLPHNGARHLLTALAVGYNKAEAVAMLTNGILDGDPVVTAIPADVLKPGAHARALADALEKASLVVDFSASVAVARHLSRSDTSARHASAFLTPRGDGLVVAVEDAQRRIRLDWLEMLHYRAVLNDPGLHDSLQSAEGKLRYGNACREVTMQLAQDDVAIWAGTASKEIKRTRQNEPAALRVFRTQGDGSTKVVDVPISGTFTLRLFDWTVRFDQWLLDELSRLRREKLPNETGGILLGSLDTQERLCSVVDVVPSPPDSTEWPTSYIRGHSGLRERVQAVEALSLGQVGYVGEWHSHPAGASTTPSGDDLKAHAWLCGHMHIEALPAIMLIIGDGGAFRLVGTETSSKPFARVPTD